MRDDLQGIASGPRLTQEQELPVAWRSEPLLLSAAAGSGKTSVLVERFVRAIREDGIAPARILAITFTERAAGELRERVRSRLLALGEREAARDAEAASVGTFHGFCARLLRAHALQAGLDPAFTILDEGVAGGLSERAFSAALAVFLEGERAPVVDLIAAYGVDSVRVMIEDAHAQLRSRGQRRPRLPVPELDADADRDARDAAASCLLLDQLLEGFAGEYERIKRDDTAVDFDDLELLAGELLSERPSIRDAWSQRFELLMVDEFQDTNRRQLAILQSLERGNLFTVGDEFQSIYGFRHAEVALFRERRDALAPVGASLALTRNFRSVAPILAVVNAVFAERFSDFRELDAARPAPSVAAPAGAQLSFDDVGGVAEEPLVELLLSTSASDAWEVDRELAEEIAAGLPAGTLWRQAEARLLAQRVSELIDAGQVKPGEVAVLLRATGDLELYERALQLRGLRTLAAAGGFWAHQQVGDLLAYLRALANPLDEEALLGLLASPLVGISRDGLALITRAAKTSGRGLWSAISGAEREPVHALLADHEQALLLRFCERFAAERRDTPGHTLSELIERELDASGYRRHVLRLEWGERRMANIHKLLRVARRFEASEGRDLRAFLDHAARLQASTGGREADAPVEGVEPDAVRLMSIHAAKGLEFPVVCVADLGRKPNSRQPQLLLDGERIGIKLKRLDGVKAKAALDYEQLCEERQRAEAEEEDRVLYVAMTRARERLLLSGAIDFSKWPAANQGVAMAAWLGQALAAEMPALAAAGEPPVHDLAVGDTRVRLHLSSPESAGRVLRQGSMSLPAPPVPAYVQGGAHLTRGRRGEPDAADTVRPPALSYTSLTELERCGYRYYLERVLGMAEERGAARAVPGAASLDARARGTIVHELLELHDFGSPEPPGEESVATQARDLGLRIGPADREEIASLLREALLAEPASRVARADSTRRELPFAFSLDDEQPLLTGVIDLLAQEPGGDSLVLDYKSDRVGTALDLEAHVEHDYGIQRLLYALAALRAGAPRVEVVHWFLERPHEPVSAAFTGAQRGELEQRLTERITADLAGGFPVSPTPHRALCQTCPGRASLCSWGDSETLREQVEPPPAASPGPAGSG